MVVPDQAWEEREGSTRGAQARRDSCMNVSVACVCTPPTQSARASWLRARTPACSPVNRCVAAWALTPAD